MTYDLIVLGGGPAGCAAAITSARLGATVLLLERGHFPRHKVCGEFVSAESLDLLEKLLGPRQRNLLARAPHIGCARIFLDDAEVRAEISPPGAGMTRFDLDQALWESAQENGVELRDDSAASAVNRRDEAFQVTAGGNLFESRALANASGRWSFLTSAQNRAQAAKERWIGLKAHFREPSPSPSVDLYFFKGGYCGVQPVTPANGEGVINVCAMARTEVATGLGQVFRLHPALRSRSASWEPMMGGIGTSPLVFHDPEPVRDGIIQVGDAATFVDPFVGDGISLAIRSGVLAGGCLGQFFHGRCSLEQAIAGYASAYRRSLSGVFRASSYLRSLLRWPAAARRPALWFLQRSPGMAKQLVRMTR
jgi:flavin-dependent dehydrogenase